MPTGLDYVRDEPRRLENLITAIAAADLWTERRLRDGSADGAASTATDSRTTFTALDYGEDIRRAPLDAQRRCQVQIVGGPRKMTRGGAFSGGEHDVEIDVEIRLAYDVLGGDSIAGDERQAREVAAQDAERVRQEIEHPDNRTAGGATGIATGRTVRVRVESVTYEFLTDEALGHGRMLAVLRAVSELRVTTEGP